MANIKPVVKNEKTVLELGHWTYIAGLLLVIFFGLGFADSFKEAFAGVLFGMGIIVGLVNITAEEITAFMYSGLVLVLVCFTGISIISGQIANPEQVSSWIKVILDLLTGTLLLFVPSTIVVTLKAVFAMAKNK